jgi:expansin (peptidoglycan-binding protein)
LNGGGFGSGSTQVRITGVTGATLIDTLPEVQAALEMSGQAQFP